MTNKKELFRLYKLVRRNGFKPSFAFFQAKRWITGLSDTHNIISYGGRPSEKSRLIGNSY